MGKLKTVLIKAKDESAHFPFVLQVFAEASRVIAYACEQKRERSSVIEEIVFYLLLP